jgi:hypothetical protein
VARSHDGELLFFKTWSVVACSGGLPSKARGGVAPGGFSGSPCPVHGA